MGADDTARARKGKEMGRYEVTIINLLNGKKFKRVCLFAHTPTKWERLCFTHRTIEFARDTGLIGELDINHIDIKVKLG